MSTAVSATPSFTRTRAVWSSQSYLQFAQLEAHAARVAQRLWAMRAVAPQRRLERAAVGTHAHAAGHCRRRRGVRDAALSSRRRRAGVRRRARRGRRDDGQPIVVTAAAVRVVTTVYSMGPLLLQTPSRNAVEPRCGVGRTGCVEVQRKAGLEEPVNIPASQRTYKRRRERVSFAWCRRVRRAEGRLREVEQTWPPSSPWRWRTSKHVTHRGGQQQRSPVLPSAVVSANPPRQVVHSGDACRHWSRTEEDVGSGCRTPAVPSLYRDGICFLPTGCRMHHQYISRGGGGTEGERHASDTATTP